MKHFAILVGACLFGLAGCVIETTSGSNGGSAGSTATGGSAGGGVGGGTAGSTSMGGNTGGSTGGSTGGTGGSACVTCGDYITNGGTLCDGTSTDLYNALSDCTCTGACKDVCADNVCNSMDITADCQSCIIDTAAGCGTAYQECANDI
ncbi:MAG: hypothetical protein U0441_00080 [Polyangiaceae bacterium]